MTNNTNLWVVITVLALLLGLGLGALFYATEEQVIIKQDKEVVKTVEVIKTVPKDYTTEAVNLFLDRLETDSYDKYLVCDKNRYENEQISVNKIFDNSKVSISRTDTDDKLNALKEVVSFKVRLKYEDALTQEKCYKEYSLEVVNIEGEEVLLKVK